MTETNENKDRMYAMMRYQHLFDQFPLQTQTLITAKYGTRLNFKQYSPQQINGICDLLSKALFLEEERLHNFYKTVIEGEVNG